MRMRKSNDVNRANRAGPKIRRHHILTDIELRTGLLAKRWNAASIHQHAFPIWKGHQQTIALPYINRRQFQLPRVSLGCKRMPYQQCQQHRRHGDYRRAKQS
jgi:hypothetical protein